ncbi:MAG TPA: sulfurtransferase TusA family protein [Nitrospiria bacterium]
MTPPIAQKLSVDTTKIPNEILQEIEIFEGEVRRFQSGEITNDQFKPFRLQHGIYGQRQAGYQMLRTKIPQGRLNADQIRRLADLGDSFSTGICHLSTRQNIQMHFIKLENVSMMMRVLAEVGLTTREACADTVRNVTACPLAGISPDEIMDVSPYGLAITQFFLRNPICQRLPRKFKIALEGCAGHDHAVTTIHDIGIRACERDGRAGFRILVGGGLGSTPRTAHVLSEFSPPEDLLAICEAVIRVFDRHGQRQNRYKARLKFLIEKIGFAQFVSLWKTEFDRIKSQNGHYTLPAVTEIPARKPVSSQTWRREDASGPFAAWLRHNVLPQKQAGYSMVTVKVPLGDIRTAQLRVLADVCEKFANSQMRITVQQNASLRWIHEADIPAVYDALCAAGLGGAGAERIENIVACPGTDTCGLSLTSSKGLARAVAELFPEGDPSNNDLAGMSIKISGCQNACAQHQLASIGFHGVGKKVGDHSAPFYDVHLGGSNTRIGQAVVKIPAKRAPDAVGGLIRWYREARQANESFELFADRVGKDTLKEHLMPYTFLPSYKEDRSYYVDWGDDKDFSTEDLGPGECAGGAYEMMEGFLFEADQELHLARVMKDKGQTGHAVNMAYRAIIAASKALLVLEGVTTSVDADILFKTETLLVGKEILPREYARLSDLVQDMGPKTPDSEFAQKKIDFTKTFVAACHTAFAKHGGSLKPSKNRGAAEAPEPGDADSTSVTVEPDVRLDLRGVACPINYVKTKLKLEDLEIGQRLEVLLDEGEPIRNVPKSLQGDGQKILAQEKQDDHYYKLLIEKVV